MKAKQDNRLDGGATASSEQDARSSLVGGQLERIFANGEFSRAHLVQRMLRFMVDRALMGRVGDLNERTIAVQVFDRGEDWDSKIDPVVRLTAMRLRTKLEGYYSSAGKEDQVCITVPKGQYVPHIEVRVPASEVQPAMPALLPQRTRKRSFLVWTAASVGTILAMGISISHYLDTRFAAVLPVTPISAELGTQFAPALSPDGTTAAYVWDGDGHNLDIYTKNLRSGRVTRMTNDPDPDLNPAFSPDGRWIAFLRVHNLATTLIVMPSSGPPTERHVTSFRAERGKWVADASPLLGNPGPEWTPDGGSVLLSLTSDDGLRHSLAVVSVATGARREIVRTDGELRDYYPRISPDGRHLAFARYASHGVSEVYVADADGSNARALTANLKTVQGISWKPDGRTIIFASNQTGSFQLWSISIDGGNARQLALNSSSAAQPAIRGDKLLFIETIENWNIWKSEIAHGHASEPIRLISSSGRNYDPRVSPDGKTIAFVSDRSGGWQLWLADIDGTNIRQLTHFTTTWLGTPNWSPDGRRIVFDARPDGHSGIFVADVSSGDVNKIQESTAEERSPSWSRDGRSIYYNSNRDGVIAVYRKNISTGKITRMTQADVFGSGESFDGKLLYFNTQRAGELWRENVDGTRPARVLGTPNLFPPMSWALFNDGIYFSTNNDEADEYMLWSLIDGKVSMIGKTKAPIVFYTPSLGASPDGRVLLFAEQDQIRSDLKMTRIRDH